MSESGEYTREYRLYLERLRVMANALVELKAIRDAEFVASLERQIKRQGPEAWGPSGKQQDVLTRIEQTHGALLFDKAKRAELVRRREEFMQRFQQLQQSVSTAGDARSQAFLTSLESQMRSSRPLSDRQKDALKTLLNRYKIAYSYDRRG